MGWEDIAIQGANALINQGTAKQEFERTKKLMGIQQQNQQALNEQGQQLQMQTWEQTNYPAQMQMLKKAGLNAGLMYAKGGAGGTTGSQGGGSASMGSAPRSQPMDMANIMATRQMGAQTSLTEAQTDLAKAQAENLRGVVTEKGKTEISKLIAETTNEQLKGELMKVQTSLESIRTANEQSVIDANLSRTAEEVNRLRLENKITAETTTAVIKTAIENATGATLENELTREKISLTDTEQRVIATKIVQEWQRISMEGRKLDQADTDLAIKKFSAEINAEYPGMLTVVGSVMKKLQRGIEGFGSKFGTKNPKDEVK